MDRKTEVEDIIRMQNPTVSFIVPCYNLAHLLSECVNSILSQSFRDLEVLIMDDRSPDNTEEVANSFQDSRVKHIRNETNLGFLRNANKGIELARGKYIWLISADDCLRRTYVLERYVEQLDRNPSVGYAYCSGVGLKDGQETGVLAYSVYADRDLIVPGHKFLKKLLRANIILAPSVLVRRECYDQLGAYPLDMNWTGDWYLWCLFALHFDVAYFADPMVCYREHALNISIKNKANGMEACFEEDIGGILVIKHMADAAGYRDVSKYSLAALVYLYGRRLLTGLYHGQLSTMTWEQFESSLNRHTASEEEKSSVHSKICALMADNCYARGDELTAKQYYQACLDHDRWNVMVHTKKFLLSLGKPGRSLRKVIKNMPLACLAIFRRILRIGHPSSER